MSSIFNGKYISDISIGLPKLCINITPIAKGNLKLSNIL